MLRVLLGSPVGRTLRALSAGLLLVIIATAWAQIRLNRWNQPFYDALSRRSLHDFLVQLGVFLLIAGVLLVLGVAQRWLGEMLKVKLREGLVRDLLHRWMRPRRAFWLATTSPLGVNPDQRMHEDARKLAELSCDLGIPLLQASVLLVSFVGVLWVISRDFSLHLAGRDLPVPGYMVWAALIYAGAGSLLSYRVGRGLIERNAERYAREADLRFALIRVNEHLDGISLAAGESGELRRIEMHLENVLAATRRLVLGLTHLTWVTAGFGWVTLVAPILVAAPLYFAGRVSFGGLMMAAAAFTQAQTSLRWFVDNFPLIADWRATLLRVAAFHHAVSTTEAWERGGTRIEYAEGAPGSLRIEALTIVSPAGVDRLREPHIELGAGERLLICTARGAGNTPLFRALAGLWPWGSGRIVRPGGQLILYLPRGTPYLPRGNLREVLAYPQDVARFGSADFVRVLERFELERLVPLLAETHRWDRELTQEELAALAFARILLHQPAWLVMDQNLAALEGATLERVIEVFNTELRGMSLIHIGGAEANDPFHSRIVHLLRNPAQPPFPQAKRLTRERSA